MKNRLSQRALKFGEQSRKVFPLRLLVNCLANVTLLEKMFGSSLRKSPYGQIKTRLVRDLGTAMLCCKHFKMKKCFSVLTLIILIYSKKHC